MSGKKTRKISASGATVIAAFCGLVGAILGAFFQAHSGVWSEKERRQSEIILKAIDEEDDETAAANLLFYVKAGLIDDPNGKIAELARVTREISVSSKDLLAADSALRGDSCGISIEAPRLVYSPGDYVEASLRSNRSCYFRVFWVDQTGRTLFMNPVPWDPTEPDLLEAGGVYNISSREQPKIMAAPPLGMDVLIVIAKPSPFDLSANEWEFTSDQLSISDLIAAHVPPDEIDDVSVAMKLLLTVSSTEDGV